MRTLLILLFILIGFGSYSQTELTKVKKDLYIAKVYCDVGNLTQTGFYKEVDNELEPHRRWKQYTPLGTLVVKYDEGQLQWIKLYDGRKYTKSEIEVMKLKLKVQKLEILLANN